MESLLWLNPPPSPAPLSSALRCEQKPSVPSQSPVSPRHQPVSCSRLCPLPENCPLSPARRSLFQGTCLLLAGPDGGSMVPAVCCVPLSARRTSGPETLRSTAACCVSSAVLPSVCWASSGGRSTSLGHVARGGVSAQAPPSASPLLLPSLVVPLPRPPLSVFLFPEFC